LGRRLGAQVTGRAVFLLEGELGAGKTVFTRGLVTGLGGNPDDVSSPTFTLVNRYEHGRLRVYHLDLYRAESAGDLEGLGIEEILGEEAVVVVEWAEKLAWRPGGAVTVKLLVDPEAFERRMVEIE
jgi:tRNA threonylcarbamoyladenosine biosynthesis protein TsaE